ncbi:MAG: hypothetical protein ACOZQL_25495 [Myxococcota bacterium]
MGRAPSQLGPASRPERARVEAAVLGLLHSSPLNTSAGCASQLEPASLRERRVDAAVLGLLRRRRH